jgi:uncharacterized protein (TIRG00374 family)
LEQQKNITTKILRFLFSLVAAAVLMSVVVWLADVDELWRRVAQANVGFIALSLCTFCLAYWARALRFAAAGARASLWTLYWVAAVHGALNRIMPFRAGELAYPLLTRRLGAAGFGEGVAQLLVLRILDLLALACLFLVALVLSLVSGQTALGQASLTFVGGAIVLALSCWIVLTQLGRLLGWGVALARWLAAPDRSGVWSRLARRLVPRADQLLDTVAAMTVSQRLLLISWSTLCWVAYFATFHLMLLATAVDLSFLSTALGSSAAIVASVLPLSALGTFGALEGGWTAGFVAVGLSAQTAASTALLISGLTLTFSLLLGGVGWLVLGNKAEQRPQGS